MQSQSRDWIMTHEAYVLLKFEKYCTVAAENNTVVQRRLWEKNPYYYEKPTPVSSGSEFLWRKARRSPNIIRKVGKFF